jgi:putative transposase
VILSHRIRAYPNNVQQTYFRRACGIRRFAYNWALAESRKLYEAGKKTSGFDLVKRFNSIKGEEFPWTSEVSKWAPQKAIQDAWDALRKWWSKKAWAPRFKKKGRCRESFYLGAGHFSSDGERFRVPKLGWVRMAQEVRFPGEVKFVTVSQEGERWFASFQVEIDESKWSYPHVCETQTVCGVDVGVRDLVVLNDGTKIVAPRGLRRRERKLRKLQRSVSRKVKGSNGQRKAIRVLGEVHRKVRDARKAVTHEVTARLVQNFRWIGVEDLNVRGMLKNHQLARSVADAAFGEIRRQLGYKSVLAGSEIVVADRWFPSSKTCSDCDYVLKELPLEVREWVCEVCGVVHDRDVNAAINLRNVAARYAETKNAGGSGCKTFVPLDEGSHVKLPEVGYCQSEMVAV